MLAELAADEMFNALIKEEDEEKLKKSAAAKAKKKKKGAKKKGEAKRRFDTAESPSGDSVVASSAQVRDCLQKNPNWWICSHDVSLYTRDIVPIIALSNLGWHL